MSKKTFTFIMALSALLVPAASQADTFMLKSGQVIRGKLVGKTDNNYIVIEDGETEKKEIPIYSVSIADIDPSSKVFPKGSATRLGPPPEEGEKEAETTAPGTSALVVPAGATTLPTISKPRGGIHKYADILKNAEETVALHNARTEQINKSMEEMKAIADASQGRTSSAS
jgi:hypothetical protein